MGVVRRIGLVAMVAFASLGAASDGSARGAASDELARGDSAWAQRGAGHHEGRPQADPILGAIRSYESALATSPESLEARWKLLRALHFAGDFVLEDAPERRAIFERARSVSEEGLDRLASRLDPEARLDEKEPEAIRAELEAADVSPREVARLYFWSAINWGAWSRDVGLLSAVRQGVANRVYRYTRVTLALEPDYDDGGALRLLGRLHAELPRVPFVSGWVERDQAISLIERAYGMAPENPGNRLLLGLTLLDLAPERRDEALALLDQVGQLSPRPTMRIEDLAMRQEARETLTRVRGVAS